MHEADPRPSPDALLAEAAQEGRGRLKIFLGAAPGVGKTFAMLEAARERRREGVDVVVGLVETHGRRETEALLDGLTVLPRLRVPYRERTFEELDLDALLARKPGLALVDELAHSNVPGSRHLKRWQDVEELLAAGIDVATTVNIQHVESLNDVVEQISGVRVRETVPDAMIAAAAEIELIDLPPDELIKRLNEGKVYLPEQARRAVHHFFSPGTLTALREMALRHAAERVDRQMVDFMRAHAIAGPWPARERVLVCIDERADALRLVRVAKRAAERRGAALIAATVETPKSYALSEAEKDRIDAAMRLAARLGGETANLEGDDVVAAVLGFARERNVTQIVVGRARPGRWGLGKPVTDRLIAAAGQINVLVVGGGPDKPLPRPAPPRSGGWAGFGLAVAAAAAATGLGFAVDRAGLPIANISVGYLMAVLLTAMRAGLRPAIAASLASFFAFNFLFTEPRYSFAITDTQNILTVVLFLAAATIGGKSLVLTPEAGGALAIVAGYPPEDRLDDKSAAAAEWAWAQGKIAGRGSETLPAADWLFLPLATGRGRIGVLGVQMTDRADAPSAAQLRLLETLADQAAVAIERTTLVTDMEAAKVATERERLRAALLSSLSHDLRTPLVSILGAATSLVSYDGALDAVARRELAQTIQDEAERLNRFVQNLLDMTRLGAGALEPKTDWADLADIVRAAVDRARRIARRHVLKIEIAPEVPLLRVDAVLIEQAVFNLIDNACKYAPPATVVKIWAKPSGADVLIEVVDQGPGIPPEDREKVFEMFYRVGRTDSRSGTGLGLAICRGIVEAHGGAIRVDEGINGVGAAIVIRLPLAAAPPLPEAAA
ncbi:Two-component sensor [uncultured Alphaproteobacteria bacterium]|uniref:histidine kinase n=1 Tax=uncultured Alphaproteobacteria bacterium TaxID=91750 RepID=A0A212JYW7_9PROT|nr:Two-component sensor [uncultured Alphaproteobacteria bacterium]